jgi:acetyl esterase/lipase
MGSNNSITKALKRELVRAMLQRTQTMNMSGFMSAVGAVEPKVYDDVKDTLNITYVNREEVALAMDVFQPKVPEGTELPVIVIVHGGGLFMGSHGQERPFSRLLAHKGYLVFSLEYRLAPQATIF